MEQLALAAVLKEDDSREIDVARLREGYPLQVPYRRLITISARQDCLTDVRMQAKYTFSTFWPDRPC